MKMCDYGGGKEERKMKFSGQGTGTIVYFFLNCFFFPSSSFSLQFKMPWKQNEQCNLMRKKLSFLLLFRGVILTSESWNLSLRKLSYLSQLHTDGY